MIRRPPRSTHCISSAASDVYKRQGLDEPLTMIAIATTLFLAIKTHSLLIYRERRREHGQDFQFDFASCLGWYTVWWGLKPSEFFERHPTGPIERSELVFAGLKCVVGVLLLTLVVPSVLNHSGQSAGREIVGGWLGMVGICLLYTSPSPRDATLSRMPSSA